MTRGDGVTLGFTDHDGDLSFGGIVYRAGTGLTARAFAQTTGLAVDNSEAMGALSDAAVSEADVEAGRYDGARLRAWAVNWANPSQRALRFRGTFGEITRRGGAFEVELRGLTEALKPAAGPGVRAGLRRHARRRALRRGPGRVLGGGGGRRRPSMGAS